MNCLKLAVLLFAVIETIDGFSATGVIKRAVLPISVQYERRLSRKYDSRLHAGFGKVTATEETKAQSIPGDANCLCGSGSTYSSCCQPQIESASAPTPESLIRSRYAAYSSENVEHIISTTSKSCADYVAFMEDSAVNPKNAQKRWARSIKTTMVNDYKYVRLEVDSVEVDSSGIDARVTWRHLAIRKQDNVMYPIQEVSHLSKVGESWLYVKGEVTRPLPEQSQTMMSEWPKLMGMELKPIDGQEAAGAKSSSPSGKFNRPGVLSTGSDRGNNKRLKTNPGGAKKNSKPLSSP